LRFFLCPPSQAFFEVAKDRYKIDSPKFADVSQEHPPNYHQPQL
jgi:hypothetical protein